MREARRHPHCAAILLTLGLMGAAHAQMPVVLMDNEPAAPKAAHGEALWAIVGPMLQAALECREDLPDHPLISVLLATAPKSTDDEPKHLLTPPKGFTVFGLPVAEIRISLFDEERGAGYSSVFHGMPLAQIAKAANLEMDGDFNASRDAGWGFIWDGQPSGPAWARLSCIIPGSYLLSEMEYSEPEVENPPE